MKPEDRVPIRSTWNPTRLIMGKPLTDRKIRQYEREGYYSKEAKEGRRARQALKSQRRNARGPKRDGMFLIYPDGRMVYSP